MNTHIAHLHVKIPLIIYSEIYRHVFNLDYIDTLRTVLSRALH